MTHQDAGGAPIATPFADALARAQAKFEEIKAEGSVPPDLLSFMSETLNLAIFIEADLATAEAALDGFDTRIEALETRPEAQAISASGINLTALEGVKARIATERDKGALGGVVGDILAGLVAAVDSRETAPPAPAQPAPAQPSDPAPEAPPAGEAAAPDPAPEAPPPAGEPAADPSAQPAAEGAQGSEQTQGQ